MAPPPSSEAKLSEAKKVAKTEPAKAESVYKEVLAKSPGSNQAALQDYESALLGLGELYRDNKRADDLAELVKTSRSTLSSFAKAKTAKLGTASSMSARRTVLTGNQFGNCLTTSQRSQIPSNSRSQPPSHVSIGPIPKSDPSSAKTLKRDWLGYICRSSHTMTPSR